MEKKSAEITALVERARKGDKTASAELYEKMYDKLYFFALKNVRSKEDAEDIVQEAFMKALESLDELNSSESFSGWIYSVTYNLCIDKMRGGKRVARFETEDDRDNAIENSALNEPVMVPEDYMQNEETKRQIKDVIDGLRPDMRSAVILYYYDQMSIAEIAETMNLSESSVKSKLYQARKKAGKARRRPQCYGAYVARAASRTSRARRGRAGCFYRGGGFAIRKGGCYRHCGGNGAWGSGGDGFLRQRP